MSDVEFQEEEDLAIRRPVSQKSPDESGLIGMIIKAKLAKDVKQANQVLIAIGIGCVVLAVAIYFGTQAASRPRATPVPGIGVNPGVVAPGSLH